jgi:membrane associated rhomboid family serine protease
MAVCYRHKDRETGVSCSNCGRPICPDCMTATPVGMRCPECSRQRTKTQTLQSMYGQPTATYVIMGICIVMWLGEYLSGGRGSQVYEDFSLIGGALNADGDTIGVAAGEYWRLITSGFLHDPRNPLHLGFNMYVLYWLGTMLEPVLGTARFVGLYFASLLAGALGALLLTDTTAATTGASGAVFGLMAAAFVMQRARGINPMQSGIGPVILLNLGITFLIPGISIGGHLGGLAGGALAASLIDRLGVSRRGAVVPVAVCAVIAVVCAVAAVAVADHKAESRGIATLPPAITRPL